MDKSSMTTEDKLKQEICMIHGTIKALRFKRDDIRVRFEVTEIEINKQISNLETIQRALERIIEESEANK